MKKCKNLGKRGLAVLIALFMCVGILPLTAFADDGPLDLDAALQQMETAVKDAADTADGFTEDVVGNYIGEDGSVAEDAEGDIFGVDGDISDVNTAIDEAMQAIDQAVGSQQDEIDEALKELDDVNANQKVKDGVSTAEEVKGIAGDNEDGTKEDGSNGSLKDTEDKVAGANDVIDEKNATTEGKVTDANKQMTDTAEEAGETITEVGEIVGDAEARAQEALDEAAKVAGEVGDAAKDGRLTQQDIDNLQSKVDELSDIVGQADDAVNAAEDRYEKAAERVEDLKKLLQDALEAVRNANDDVVQNEQDVADYVKELEGELTKASEDLAAAKTALETAKGIQDQAQKFRDLAQDVLDALDDAEDAQNGRSVDDLKQKLDELKGLVANEADAKLKDAQAQAEFNAAMKEAGLEGETPLFPDDVKRVKDEVAELNVALTAKTNYDNAKAAAEAGLEGFEDLDDDAFNAMKNADAEYQKAEKATEADTILNTALAGLSDEDRELALKTLKELPLNTTNLNWGQLKDRPGLGKIKEELHSTIIDALQNCKNAGVTNLNKTLENAAQTMAENQAEHDQMEALKKLLDGDYDESKSLSELQEAAKEAIAGKIPEDVADAWAEAKDALTKYGDELNGPVDEKTIKGILTGMINGRQTKLNGNNNAWDKFETAFGTWGAEEKGGTAGELEKAEGLRKDLTDALRAYFTAKAENSEAAETILDLILAQAALSGVEGDKWIKDEISKKISDFDEAQETVKKALEAVGEAQDRVTAAQEKLKDLHKATTAKAGNLELPEGFKDFADYEAYLKAQVEQAEADLEAERGRLDAAVTVKEQAEAALLKVQEEVNALKPYIPPVDDNDFTDVTTVDDPEVDTPEADVPEIDTPETDVPEVNAPEVDVPEVNAPEANVPNDDDPVANAPAVNAPEAVAPAGNDALLDIADGQVPLAGAPAEDAAEAADPEPEETLIDIADGEVPLAGAAGEDASEGGNGILPWAALGVVSCSGVGAAAWLFLKKKVRG